MNTQTITFDDVEMTINGNIWTASGSFVAVYHMNPAEPDCGIMFAYPEIDAYHDVDVFLSLYDEDGEILASQHVKDDAILPKLIKAIGEDNVYEEIIHAL